MYPHAQVGATIGVHQEEMYVEKRYIDSESLEK